MSTPNYKVKKFMRRDEAEWIRVEQSHEAIIDEDTFRVTQELLKKDVRRGPEKGKVYPLSGYLVCADCGQSMIRKSAVSGGKKYYYYVCSGHKARKKTVSRTASGKRICSAQCWPQSGDISRLSLT